MKSLSKYVVSQTETIKHAVSVIQGNRSRCVIVINANNRVVGVVSEGDVLRFILQGIDLHTPLNRVITPSFKYLTTEDMRRAYELVNKFGITLIPIVDEDFRLKDIISIFDVMKYCKYANAS